MDLTHAHLFLNHVPIICSLIAFVFLGYAPLFRKPELVKLSLWFFLIIAIIFIPVYLTGEPAEENIEKNFGVPEDIVDKHEEAALVSLVIISLLGAVSIAGLFLYRKATALSKWFAYLLVILNIAIVISFARTATLGGEIRHIEIRGEQIIIP